MASNAAMPFLLWPSPLSASWMEAVVRALAARAFSVSFFMRASLSLPSSNLHTAALALDHTSKQTNLLSSLSAS
jgi:hypothetical protein